MANVVLDGKGARRSHRGPVGQPQVLQQAGEPEQQAQVRHHRRGHGTGRRVRGGVARPARVRRQGVHVPRLAASGPLHRRSGRHQRGQELQERRRLGLPPLLRHGEGRRLPGPRVERLPARSGEREHHRPVRRAGRAVRTRVRRVARQPVVRRCSSEPYVLRARPDRPAVAARRLPGAHATGRDRAP